MQGSSLGIHFNFKLWWFQALKITLSQKSYVLSAKATGTSILRAFTFGLVRLGLPKSWLSRRSRLWIDVGWCCKSELDEAFNESDWLSDCLLSEIGQTNTVLTNYEYEKNFLQLPLGRGITYAGIFKSWAVNITKSFMPFKAAVPNLGCMRNLKGYVKFESNVGYM